MLKNTNYLLLVCSNKTIDMICNLSVNSSLINWIKILIKRVKNDRDTWNLLRNSSQPIKITPLS
jgi:hypothetical protein